MGWTRCKDELPKKDDCYLVVLREETTDPFVSMGIYMDGKWAYTTEFTVTHWMALPSLPDEEDEHEQDA